MRRDDNQNRREKQTAVWFLLAVFCIILVSTGWHKGWWTQLANLPKRSEARDKMELAYEACSPDITRFERDRRMVEARAAIGKLDHTTYPILMAEFENQLRSRLCM